MKKAQFKMTLFILAFFMVILSCQNNATTAKEKHSDSEIENENHGSAIHMSKEMLQVANLEIVEVEYRQIRRFINAPAKIIPNQNQEAHVGPLIEGRAAQILVNQGDWRKAGQVLMFLESPQVGEAKGAYFKAKAELAFAKANHERQKKLFDEKIGSQKGLAEAEAAYQKAMAELDATENHLQAIGFSADEIQSFKNNHESTALLPIKAPISGTIVERNVTIGQRIEPSSDVFHIIDLSKLWVDADVYEKDIDYVKIGNEMEIQVPAYASRLFKGKVIFISDVLDEQTRTFTVRALVENRERKLKPQMFADVRIYTEQEEGMLAVPKAAIYFNGNQELVYISETPGVFVPRAIERGREDDGYVEISSGLNLGERIVGRGAFLVKSEAEKEAFGEGHH